MNGVLKCMFEEHHEACGDLVEEMSRCLGQLTGFDRLLFSCEEWQPDVNQLLRDDLVQTWKTSVLALARIADCYASVEPFAYTERFLESALNELERAYLKNLHFFGHLLGYVADAMANEACIADLPANGESICNHLQRMHQVFAAVREERRLLAEPVQDNFNVEASASVVSM